MRTLTLIAAMLLTLTGCPGPLVKADLPKETLVTVEKYKPLPEWATKKIAKPARKDDTFGAHLSHENALEAFVDYLFCGRELLAKLDRGEQVNPDDCKEPKP